MLPSLLLIVVLFRKHWLKRCRCLVRLKEEYDRFDGSDSFWGHNPVNLWGVDVVYFNEDQRTGGRELQERADHLW